MRVNKDNQPPQPLANDKYELKYLENKQSSSEELFILSLMHFFWFMLLFDIIESSSEQIFEQPDQDFILNESVMMLALCLFSWLCVERQQLFANAVSSWRDASIEMHKKTNDASFIEREKERLNSDINKLHESCSRAIEIGLSFGFLFSVMRSCKIQTSLEEIILQISDNTV